MIRRSAVSFCHVSEIVSASELVDSTAERNASQYPSGKDGSPETSSRHPSAPRRSHCFVIASSPVRKYDCAAGSDFVSVGIESNPNHASYEPAPAQTFVAAGSPNVNHDRYGELCDS